MQGSFEKRVQEKLDELRLTPSEPVWKTIEKEIRPEKRRRFPFWIPFVVVLLGGAAWWLLEGRTDDSASFPTGITTSPRANEETNTITIPEASPKEQKAAETNKATTSSTKGNATLTDYTNNRKNNIGKSQTILPIRNAEAGLRSAIAANGQQLHVAGKAAPEKSSMDQAGNEANANTPVSPDKIPSQPDIQQQPSPENAKPLVQQPSVGEPVETALSLDDTTAKTADSVQLSLPEKNDSSIQKTKIAAAKKRWQKIVTVKGGWSRYSDGILGGNLRLADFSSSPATGNYNGVAGNPSPVKKGAAFQVGIGFSKAIHSRWNVAIGLQYAYYSTQTQVGTYKAIDTTVLTTGGNISLEGYYSNTTLRDYTMRYGMLELPLSLGFRPMAKFPLALSLGASYGRLLHSNALQYNRWGNFYYADKDVLRKNLFAGFASLQFAFINKAAWQLEAGPIVQYHLSGLQKNTTGPKLFFAGLQTNIRF